MQLVTWGSAEKSASRSSPSICAQYAISASGASNADQNISSSRRTPLVYTRFLPVPPPNTLVLTGLVDEAAAPASTTTSAYLKEQAENMGERECFGAAVDEAGEDIACDAWFYGEDPTVEKAEVAVDAARLEALKEEGRAAVAARRRREAEAAEFLARRNADG